MSMCFQKWQCAGCPSHRTENHVRWEERKVVRHFKLESLTSSNSKTLHSFSVFNLLPNVPKLENGGPLFHLGLCENKLVNTLKIPDALPVQVQGFLSRSCSGENCLRSFLKYAHQVATLSQHQPFS